MKPPPSRRPQRAPGSTGINALELGKQLCESVFCLGFTCADKDTPPWAKHIINAALAYLRPSSRESGEAFPEKLVGSVALIRSVTAAVKRYWKPVHQRKARAAMRELVKNPKLERS